MCSASVGINHRKDDTLRVAWLNAVVNCDRVACFMTLNKLCDYTHFNIESIHVHGNCYIIGETQEKFVFGKV